MDFILTKDYNISILSNNGGEKNMKKQMMWKTKGMNQDLSESAFNPEFSYENMNLRITANEKNTQLSWTSELGTKRLEVLKITDYKGTSLTPADDPTPAKIEGIPIGYAVIQKYLVLFTTSEASPKDPKDRIYRIELDKKAEDILGLNAVLLYQGSLNFQKEYPLETLTDYESDDIMKVYWTDYINQPRYINIVSSVDTMRRWNTEHHPIDTFFDFVPSISTSEKVTIEKEQGGGIFAPGVIQYCFSYINKFGAESNIVYTSPLYYTSFPDRGASPEEKVSCIFRLTLENVDYNFDYIRIYSIQRTSLDATPIVRNVVTLPIQYSPYLVEEYYSNDDSLMLPTVSRTGTYKKLSNIVITGGNCNMTWSSMSFRINATPKSSIVVCKWDDESGDYREIVDFKELLSEVHAHYQDYEVEYDPCYYVGFQFSDEISRNEIAEDYNEQNYLVVVDGTLAGFVDTFTENGIYFLYLPLQQQWVFTNELPTVSVVRNTINYIDRGIEGSTVDPTELLYVGGRIIHALTMASKDGTLFLGNIKEDYDSVTVLQDYMDSIRGVTTEEESYKNEIPITFKNDGACNKLIMEHASGTYSYTCELNYNREKITTFKGGDYYRLGFQLQKTTGEWTEPIFMYDKQNNCYPNSSVFKDTVNLPYAEAVIDFYSIIQHTDGFSFTDYSKYRKIRPVIVYPSLEDRVTLCQGVINPTVFNAEDRIDNSPYAQASWFFRPYTFESKNEVPLSVSPIDDYSIDTRDNGGCYISSKHWDNVYTFDMALDEEHHTDATDYSLNGDAPKKIEVEGSRRKYKNPWSAEVFDDIQSNTQFYVDQSIVTLNSPDLEFDSQVSSYDKSGLKLRIIGAIPITGLSSSHQVKASAMSTNTPSNDGDYISTGAGELPVNIRRNIVSLYGGKRLSAEYLWQDVICVTDSEGTKTSQNFYTYLLCPWHRQGSLTTDNRTEDKATSILDTKKMATQLFSLNTEYLPSDSQHLSFYPVSVAIHLTENDNIVNYRLPSKNSESSSINYYPNIDKVLYNSKGNRRTTAESRSTKGRPNKKPISMKYKSTTHAVISTEGYYSVPIMPYGYVDATGDQYAGRFLTSRMAGSDNEKHELYPKTFWGDRFDVSQNKLDITNLFVYNEHFIPFDYLWLGELYKDVDTSVLFGGQSISALRNNKWVSCGEEVFLPPRSTNMKVTLRWTEGDTYYQRYDCLKTYAYTSEDTNQLMEVLSFMCETHINIDGRYDKNRGQDKGYLFHPSNFNLLNPVYSQEDNFFTSRIIKSDIQSREYPNQVTWTKTKNPASEVDLWTNITLTNVLDVEGNKGKINKLSRFNDQLLFFQDQAIGHLLYNSNTQIATTTGVPIELANSGKVDGYRYLSSDIGCANKHSIVSTPSGLYFIDSYGKHIFNYNGQFQNLSQLYGFNTWCKKHIKLSDTFWNPIDFSDFVSQYDPHTQEVYFTNKDISLAFSESMGCFTSFYNYGNTPYLCHIQGENLWIRNDSSFWQHRKGSPCSFFDEPKPFYTTLICNPEYPSNKIFTNLEFRASVEDDGQFEEGTGKFKFFLPFDTLETWNDYQHGKTALQQRWGHASMIHYGSDNISNLHRKFRVWRCDIPRNNQSTQHKQDRMYNPWLYLKLLKEGSEDMHQVQIHDLSATYYV